MHADAGTSKHPHERHIAGALIFVFVIVVFLGLGYVGMRRGPRPFPDKPWVVHTTAGKPLKIVATFSDSEPAAFLEMAVRVGGIPSKGLSELDLNSEFGYSVDSEGYQAGWWMEGRHYRFKRASTIGSPIVLDVKGMASVDLGTEPSASIIPSDPLCPFWPSRYPHDPDAYNSSLWEATEWFSEGDRLRIVLSPSTMRLRCIWSDRPRNEYLLLEVVPPSPNDIQTIDGECLVLGSDDDLLGDDDVIQFESRPTYNRRVPLLSESGRLDIPLPPIGGGGFFGVNVGTAKLLVTGKDRPQDGREKFVHAETLELRAGAIYTVDLTEAVGRGFPLKN